MLNQLLPQRIDNSYRGHIVAVWLFALVVLTKGAMSLGSIFRGYSVASGPDAIPLNTLTPAGAQTVVSLIALVGLATFLICLLGILVLARYRGMIPLMFAVLLLQSLGGKLILYFLPIARTRAPPGFYVNLILLAIMILGLVLSLRESRANKNVS